MTEFDKVQYWKDRATDALKKNFDETIIMMKNVRQTIFHISGEDPIELQRVIKEIGDSYDELAGLIRGAEVPKKKEPEIILP
jgi:peptide methionine sulfoxide reductase MsrA